MKKFLISIFLAVLILPVTVQAAPACNPTGQPSIEVCNPLGDVESIQGLLGRLMIAAGSIAGTLALGMLIYSGFRMLISQGEPEGLKAAKSGLTWAIVGIVVSSLSFVIVVAFQNFLGINPTAPGSENAIVNPLTSPDVQSFIVTVIQNFLAFVGVLAIVMIVINGFRYVTAGGNEEMVKKAKNGLLWSIGGFITIVLSYVLLVLVNNLLP